MLIIHSEVQKQAPIYLISSPFSQVSFALLRLYVLIRKLNNQITWVIKIIHARIVKLFASKRSDNAFWRGLNIFIYKFSFSICYVA